MSFAGVRLPRSDVERAVLIIAFVGTEEEQACP